MKTVLWLMTAERADHAVEYVNDVADDDDDHSHPVNVI